MERIFNSPEDYHGLGEGKWQDFMIKSEEFCETFSIPTEESPLRSPKQTEKFMDRIKKTLELNGFNMDNLSIEPVDIPQNGSSEA